MKRFQNWLEEKHPEFLQEGRLAKTLGALALGAASLGSNAYSAPEKPVPAAAQELKDVEIKEEDGKLIIKAFSKVESQEPRDRLNAMRVTEMKIIREAARYFHKRGGPPGFVPPFKVEGKSDFLKGNTDFIWGMWDISKMK